MEQCLTRPTSTSTFSMTNLKKEWFPFWLLLGPKRPPYSPDMNHLFTHLSGIRSALILLHWTWIDARAAASGRGRCSNYPNRNAVGCSSEIAQACPGVLGGVWRLIKALSQTYLKNANSKLFSSIFEFEIQWKLSKICRFLTLQFAC